MNLNRKFSIIFIIIILITSIFFALYYFLIIQRSFIEHLDKETKQLNELILLYEQKENELNLLKKDFQSDTFRKELSKYFDSKNIINRSFEKSEFLGLFKGLLNSRTTLIEQLEIRVNTKFPFVFDRLEETNIDFYLKVGDLIE
ncbi:MAG: hypothetical protein J7J43_06550 [Thermosipho sp. (in: Bacteria)]|nr:hypothetical protein [Thermosipho sp. (in: thermotogales)]